MLSKKFLEKHEDRLFFGSIALLIGFGFFYMPGMESEGKTILTFIAGMLVNKMRSTKEGDK